MSVDVATCCALSQAIRCLKDGWPAEGQHMTCSRCGRSWVRHGLKWDAISTVAEIEDLMKTNPLAQKETNDELD